MTLTRAHKTAMVRLLQVLFSMLVILMSYTVTMTSLESNLFEAWSSLAAIPWMIATLKDFYALMVPILLWMFYKEPSSITRSIWAVLFICLGSIGTSAYILLQLMRVSGPDPLATLLLKRN